MTFYAFRLLSPVIQLYWVLKHGTFLAQCWEADDDGVNLYHCADEGRSFFVEVGVDYGQEQPIVLRSFVGSEPLEDYSHYVRLPEEWGVTSRKAILTTYWLATQHNYV